MNTVVVLRLSAAVEARDGEGIRLGGGGGNVAREMGSAGSQRSPGGMGAPRVSPEGLVAVAVGSAALMFVVACLGFIVPLIAVNNNNKSEKEDEGDRHSRSTKSTVFLNYANSFSGGVMLSAGFVHLLGESSETLRSMEYEYPFAELFCGIGYLLTLLAETVAGSGHDHVAAHGCPHFAQDCDNVRDTNDDDREERQRLTDPEQAMESATLFDGGERRSLSTSSAHHNRPDDSSVSGSSITGLGATALCVGLSFHSVLEGVAIGSQGTLASMESVLIAVLLHKGLAAFVLCSIVMESRVPRKYFMLMTFAAASPIGIIAGALAQYFTMEDAQQESTFGGAILRARVQRNAKSRCI